MPFQPLTCVLSVPQTSTSGDTCPRVPYSTAFAFGLPQGNAPPAAVIGLRASLAALAPSDASQLSAAIQAALDAHRSTAIVQPGERYFFYLEGQSGGPVTARQQLRATLSYQVQPGGYPEPCTLGGPGIPCEFPGQDCDQVCTVAAPPAALAGAPPAWIAAVMVHASWRYTTLGGQLVADNIGESFGLQLATLRITWDAAGWHVTLIAGHTTGLPLADDLVCDPARFLLEGTPSWSFMLSDPPAGARVVVASDATPVDGCAVALIQAPGVKPAVFLQRFGVLLTVNDVARNSTDNLPVATTDEQRLASQLLAPLSL